MIKTINIVVVFFVLLVAGSGWAEEDRDTLPKGGGEPGKALMAFLEAAHKKDFAKIRSMYPDEASKKVTDKELEDGLLMFILFDPSALTITGGEAKGDSATLNTVSHGTITMQRLNGQWFMKQWSAHAETKVEMEMQAEATFKDGSIEVKPSDSKSPPPPAPKSPAEPDAPKPKDVPQRISFAFDPRTLRILPEDWNGGEAVVVTTTGEKKMLFHDPGSYQEVAKMAAVLKFYGVNEVLQVIMPGAREDIYLKSGRVISGDSKGEECTTIDPAALAITEFKGKYRAKGKEMSYTQYSVGDQRSMQYNEKPFAEEMVSVLKKYQITHRCRMGGFRYFRK